MQQARNPDHPNAPLSAVLLLLLPTALAEALLLVEYAAAGALIHAALVQLYLAAYLAVARDAPPLAWLPARRRLARFAPLLPALALVSIVRLLSLTLATDAMSTLFWYALIGAPSIAAALLTARTLGLGYGQIGLRPGAEGLASLIRITLLGVLLGILGFLVIDRDSLAPTINDNRAIIVVVFVVCGVGVMEEVIFRGVAQRAAGEALARHAWLWSSALYAVMLIPTDSLQVVLVFGLTGLLFSLHVRQTGSLLGVTLAHSLLRLTLLLALPALFPA